MPSPSQLSAILDVESNTLQGTLEPPKHYSISEELVEIFSEFVMQGVGPHYPLRIAEGTVSLCNRSNFLRVLYLSLLGM